MSPQPTFEYQTYFSSMYVNINFHNHYVILNFYLTHIFWHGDERTTDEYLIIVYQHVYRLSVVAYDKLSDIFYFLEI